MVRNQISGLDALWREDKFWKKRAELLLNDRSYRRHLRYYLFFQRQQQLSQQLQDTPAWNIDTWTYTVVSPDIVGVGQTTWVVFWLNAVPPTAVGAYGDRWTFNC